MIVVGEIHSHGAEFLRHRRGARRTTYRSHRRCRRDDYGKGSWGRHRSLTNDQASRRCRSRPDGAQTIAVLVVGPSPLFETSSKVPHGDCETGSRLRPHTPGSALHQYALKRQNFRSLRRLQMVHIHVHITRDKQVHVAVAIIIAPGGGQCQTGNSAKSGLLCDILLNLQLPSPR